MSLDSRSTFTLSDPRAEGEREKGGEIRRCEAKLSPKKRWPMTCGSPLRRLRGLMRDKPLLNMAMEMVLRRMKNENAHRSRLPLQLPGLGGERVELSARNHRNRIGACHRRQGRTSLSAERCLGKASQANGSMGDILRTQKGGERYSDWQADTNRLAVDS
jgi:hypothetical protein